MADDDLSRLTDNEKTALTALLRRTIADDGYPLSPRICTQRGILAKLQPPNKPTRRGRSRICLAAPQAVQ